MDEIELVQPVSEPVVVRIAVRHRLSQVGKVLGHEAGGKPRVLEAAMVAVVVGAVGGIRGLRMHLHRSERRGDQWADLLQQLRQGTGTPWTSWLLARPKWTSKSRSGMPLKPIMSMQ